MSNQNNKTNRGMLDQSRQQDNAGYTAAINPLQTQFGADIGRSNTAYNDIYNGYKGSNNFMPEGLTPNSNGWFSLPDSGGGGHVGADFSGAKSNYQKFADTGGINRGDFDPALRSYQGFMSDGGVTSGMRDNMRYRATSMVPSFYDKYKENLQRRSNVQGGYSPGFDSQSKEIGREASRAGYDASRQAESDIADKEIQGRMFGTSGFGNLMSGITGMEQQGKEFGTSGLKGIGDSELSASQANASLDESKAARNQAMQQFLMQLYSEGGKSKLGGMQNLYSSAPGAMGQTGSLLFGGLGGRSGASNNNLGIRSGIQDRSFLDYLPGLVGAGGAAMTGIGGFRKTS